MFGIGVAGEMRFAQHVQGGHPAGSRKSVRLRMTDHLQPEIFDHAKANLCDNFKIAEAVGRAFERINHPLQTGSHPQLVGRRESFLGKLGTR